jgi:hypothetical protein
MPIQFVDPKLEQVIELRNMAFDLNQRIAALESDPNWQAKAKKYYGDSYLYCGSTLEALDALIESLQEQ